MTMTEATPATAPAPRRGRHGGRTLDDRLDAISTELAACAVAIERVNARMDAICADELDIITTELAEARAQLSEVQAAQTGLALVLTPMATAVLDVLRDGWRKTRKTHKAKG